MKTSPSFLFVLALAFAPTVNGEDMILPGGKLYKNIRISGEKADSIKLMHDDGISTIPKKDLPAEFIALHHLTAPAFVPDSPEVAEKRALLAAFTSRTPTFAANDGREFKSSQIKDVEPNGLSILTDAGPVRVKFMDLPEPIREAFHYDAGKAARHDSEMLSKNKAATDLNQRMVNAASVVDGRLSHAKLTLEQNIGKGWRCHMQFIKDVDRVVTTTVLRPEMDDKITVHRRTRLKTDPPIYKLDQTNTRTYDIEKKTVQGTAIASDEGEIMMFGLPDQAHLKATMQSQEMRWEGQVYYMGLFRTGRLVLDNNRRQVPELIQVYGTDRNLAIKMVATHGLEHEFDKDGNP